MIYPNPKERLQRFVWSVFQKDVGADIRVYHWNTYALVLFPCDGLLIKVSTSVAVNRYSVEVARDKSGHIWSEPRWFNLTRKEAEEIWKELFPKSPLPKSVPKRTPVKRK